MRAISASPPYWRLSGFYFFYFAVLGALAPSLSPYLKALGFTPTEIGVLFGTTMATRIIAPNIWGWIADHTGQRMRIVQIGSLLAALCFLGIFIEQTYIWLIVVLSTFSFFWNAALPQFEATTFNHLSDQVNRYSTIRLWGSIGFILTVVGLGYLFEVVDITFLPVIISILLGLIWAVSLMVPESAAGHLHIDHEPLRKVLRKPHVLGLLLVCFCMQASHGPYYAVYSIYMESYGYSSHTIGWFWGIGVIAEVIILLLMYRIVKLAPLSHLLMLSLLLAALRWCLVALFPEHMSIMVLAQILHAATFGLYHVVAIRLIHQFFTGRHQGRGQALYSSISFGLGGAIGSIYSGFAWDYLGRGWIFSLSVIFSLLGFWLAYRYVRPGPQPM